MSLDRTFLLFITLVLLRCTHGVPVPDESTEDSIEYREFESRDCNSNVPHPCPCLVDGSGLQIAYVCSPKSSEDALKMREVFDSIEARVHERLELTVAEGVRIPSNFLGQHQARELILSAEGIRRPLEIDVDAFIASSSTLEGVEFQNLNLESMDFGFLKHFAKLDRVEFSKSKAGRHLELPSLPQLVAVLMFDTQVEDWPIPVSSTPKLKTIELFSIPDADDGKIGRLLDSIPPQVTSLTCSECGLTQLPAKIRQAYSEDVQARLKIGANAAEGELNIKELDLSDNNLTQLEPSAFRDVLESMARSGGFVDITDNPISCDCHLRWLIREQRQLLSVVRNGQCASATALEDLDVQEFEKCS